MGGPAAPGRCPKTRCGTCSEAAAARIRSRTSSGPSSAAAGRARRPLGGAAQPEGARHRVGGRAHARRGVPRRHAAHLDHARRPCAQRRRADPRRRQGRLARARGGRRRTGRERRRVGRSLPPRPPQAAPRVRAQGGRSLHEGRAARDDGCPRRRGAGPDDHRLGAPEGAGNHPAGTDLPAEGARHAARRQARHEGRPLRQRRHPAPPLPDEGTARSPWEGRSKTSRSLS